MVVTPGLVLDEGVSFVYYRYQQECMRVGTVRVQIVARLRVKVVLHSYVKLIASNALDHIRLLTYVYNYANTKINRVNLFKTSEMPR